MSTASHDELIADLLDGKHRALARAITTIENRAAGYRDLVSELHTHTGDATIVGITGSPGAGKSTLVDKLAKYYRDRAETVGVIAVDPSSPYTGGAVLGDRIRMGSTVGDMDVFFRSMSARGQLGGLATATADAVKALDAFGKDRILIETVGAGQNEVDVVKTADTVAVLVQPGSGDDVQMLKAGILEIGDVFVVNKADRDGASRTVADLEEMIHMQDDPTAKLRTGHHGFEVPDHPDSQSEEADAENHWQPPVIETIATQGEGVETFAETLEEHATYLAESGELDRNARIRAREEIRQLLRSDVAGMIEREIEARGGIEELARAVAERETDPYTVADELTEPIVDCIADRRDS